MRAELIREGASERRSGLRIRGLAVGSSQLPWAHHQLAANLAAVKGLDGLVSDRVCSRDVSSRFIPPIPKPDIAVPDAGPRLGDGGEVVPAGNIDRPPMAGKNGRLKASGIDVAAPNVGRPLKPSPRFLSRQNPPTPVRHRPARASAQQGTSNFSAANVQVATSGLYAPFAVHARNFAAHPAVRLCVA
jgi:hypothetical protein